jgi:hypothetical protein
MNTQTKLDDFTRAYIECALWSSTDTSYECDDCSTVYRDPTSQNGGCVGCGGYVRERDTPMDSDYTLSDIADETLTRMVADCDRFQAEQAEWIISEYCESRVDNTIDEKAGHDFWLTRNGHGAGFWDGDWAEPAATKLTDAAHAMGEVNLYVGDDGKVYA